MACSSGSGAPFSSRSSGRDGSSERSVTVGTPGRTPGTLERPDWDPPASGRRRLRRSLARFRLRATDRPSVSSARLAMRRVTPAPAAVLAQLEPLRVVPLALVRLVVAALALLTGEGGSNPNVSTSHVGASVRGVKSGYRTAGAETNAARRRPSV